MIRSIEVNDEKELAELVDRIAERSADIVMKRLAVRERAIQGAAPSDPVEYLTYKAAAVKINKTEEAIKKMVQRKQLRACRPHGGKSVYIDSRDLKAYMHRHDNKKY